MARAKGKEARRATRRFGVPIAVRMALVTAVLGGAVMLAFSIAIVPLVRDAVRTQLRLAAHDAAFVAAAAPLDAWNEFFGTNWQGQSPEQISELAKAMTREQREQGPRSPETNAARDWNTGRLVRLTQKRTRLEAAEVSLGSGDQRRIIASYAGESNTMSFQRKPDQEPLTLNEGDADEGTLRLTGRDIDVIRGSAPIKGVWGAICFRGRKPTCSARTLPCSSSRRTSQPPVYPRVVEKTGRTNRLSVPVGNSTTIRRAWP